MASERTFDAVVGERYWREEDAHVVVDVWRRSGRTLAEFCREHRLDPQRLSRWGKRLGPAQSVALRFLPVQVRGPHRDRDAAAALEVELPGGARIRVPAGFDGDELSRLVRVLLDAAAC